MSFNKTQAVETDDSNEYQQTYKDDNLICWKRLGGTLFCRKTSFIYLNYKAPSKHPIKDIMYLQPQPASRHNPKSHGARKELIWVQMGKRSIQSPLRNCYPDWLGSGMAANETGIGDMYSRMSAWRKLSLDLETTGYSPRAASKSAITSQLVGSFIAEPPFKCLNAFYNLIFST